jgi:hypothetical protein
MCASTCSKLTQSALDWEAGELKAGNVWSSLCLGFVNEALQHAGESIPYLQADDANASLQGARADSHFVSWTGSCPCGAILYWSANACNAGWGHVVICNGDGTASTSGWPGYGGSTHASIPWLSQMECAQPAGYIVP